MAGRGSGLQNLLINYACHALSLDASMVALPSMAFVLKRASHIILITFHASSHLRIDDKFALLKSHNYLHNFCINLDPITNLIFCFSSPP